MQLKDSILNVVSFDASQDKSHVNLRFILDSNGIAKVNGYFNVKNLKTPEFGGSVYALESGWLTAEGTFNSLAGSQKEFLTILIQKANFLWLTRLFADGIWILSNLSLSRENPYPVLKILFLTV